MDNNEELFIPDRFDMLQRGSNINLSGIIEPVREAHDYIRIVSANMSASRRGDFLIFRGAPGSGKSTFLHTLPIFFQKSQVISIPPGKDIPTYLSGTPSSPYPLRVIVIEGREALGDTSSQEVEASVHAINHFLRSKNGEKTIIVWPANTDDLSSTLEHSAKSVGGDSLLGIEDKPYFFTGPPKSHFRRIANNTISLLNQGATLSDLGVSTEISESLAESSPTIGNYLGKIRGELLKNRLHVQQLLNYEQCKLWVLVIAGNDPDGDVAALTRSTNASIDIERLLGSTEANIVNDLKKYPSELGILGTVLDAKIIHLPIKTAMSIARDFADPVLHKLMEEHDFSKKPDNDSILKIQNSEIGKIMSGQSLGVRSRGAKVGNNTSASFEKLSKIASTNDSSVNKTIGKALTQSGYINDFQLEVPFKGSTNIRTDIVCNSVNHGDIRLEVMWRKRTSRADISNYVLNKLYVYGKNIKLLT